MINLKVKYLLLANYLNLFAFAFFAPLYALFVTGLGATPKVVGLSAGVGAYATAVMILLFGKWENHHKHKEKMVVLGYFWLAAGAAAYALIDHVWQLFAVQIFNAIGTGILSPALKATYASKEDKGREIQEWSFWDGGNSLFTATGAMLGGFLLAALGGYKPLFLLIAAIQLMAAFIAIRILR